MLPAAPPQSRPFVPSYRRAVKPYAKLEGAKELPSISDSIPFHPRQRKSPPRYIISRHQKQVLCSYPKSFYGTVLEKLAAHPFQVIPLRPIAFCSLNSLARFFHSSGSHLGRRRRCRIARGIGIWKKASVSAVLFSVSFLPLFSADRFLQLFL